MSGPGRPDRSAWMGFMRPAILAALLWVMTVPLEVTAQERPEPTREPEAPAPREITVSPGGAFLRAALVPGWGHASIGSYTRGGFYFAAQSASVYTLLRARLRLSQARDQVRFREGIARQLLSAGGVTDAGEIEEALDNDVDLRRAQNLVDARQGQQEDMVALSLFILFISGADAYVSAHLARFPDPLDLEANPGANGGVEVGLRLTLPN